MLFWLTGYSTDLRHGSTSSTAIGRSWQSMAILMIARDSGITVIDANFLSAKNHLNENKIKEAYADLWKSEGDLNKTLIAQRGIKWPLPNWEYTMYFLSTRGVIPTALAIILLFIFVYSLMKYPNLPGLPNEIRNVPLWAGLFGGVGACVQILFGVASDMASDGVVSGYKRTWYMFLPLVALVLGYIAYVLVDWGFGGANGVQADLTASNVSLIKVTGANSFSWIHNGTGNYSFTARTAANLATTGMGPFTLILGMPFRIIASFMAGYATDDFTKRLHSAWEKVN